MRKKKKMKYKLNVTVNEHLTKALEYWFEKEKVSNKDITEWLKTSLVDAADDLFVTLYGSGPDSLTGDDALVVTVQEK